MFFFIPSLFCILILSSPKASLSVSLEFRYVYENWDENNFQIFIPLHRPFPITIFNMSTHAGKTILGKNLRYRTNPKLPFPSPPRTINIIDVRGRPESFRTVSKSRYFNKAEDYFIFISEEKGNPPISKSEDIKNKVGLSFSKNSINIHEFCYFCNNPRHSTIKSIKFPIDLSISFLFPLSTKHNFEHRNFRVSASYAVKVRVSIFQKSPGVWDLAPTIFRHLLDSLTQKYNFTMRILPASGGGGTGSQLPNGTWTGTVGDVYNEVAHIGCVAGSELHRNRIVALTSPLEYQQLVLVTGKHFELLTFRLLSIPLGPDVWGCLGLSLLLAIIFMYSMQSLYKRHILGLMRKEEAEAVVLWPNYRIVENIFARFFEEDIPDVSPTPLRIFMILWLFLSMLMGCVYSSKLYAALAFPPIEAQPSDFRELLSSGWAWGLNYVGDMGYLTLKNSNNSVYQRIFKGMDLHRDPGSCVKEAVLRNYACFTYTSIMDFIVATSFPQIVKNMLKESAFSFYTSDTSLVLPKDSPLEEPFSQVIGQSVAQGLGKQWLEMFHAFLKKRRVKAEQELRREGKSPPRIFTEEQELAIYGGVAKLSLIKLRGAFFAHFVGLAFATSAMLWEWRKRAVWKFREATSRWAQAMRIF